EALLKGLGPVELNGKGKAMCAQVRPVLAKFPFNPTAQQEVTIQEFDSVFKPKEGVIWELVDGGLQKYLTKQGTHYVVNPSGGVNITPAFLGFVNHAADFTEAAYRGGSGPKFTYSVKPELSPDMQSIKLTIDGQAMTFSGSATSKPLVWPGTARGVEL